MRKEHCAPAIVGAKWRKCGFVGASASGGHSHQFPSHLVAAAQTLLSTRTDSVSIGLVRARELRWTSRRDDELMTSFCIRYEVGVRTEHPGELVPWLSRPSIS